MRAGSWRWDSRAVGFFCSGDGVDPADLTDAFPLGGLPILLVSFARSPPASLGEHAGVGAQETCQAPGDETWEPP